MNIKPEAIKLLGFGYDMLKHRQKAQNEPVGLKDFCYSKGNNQKLKKQLPKDK